jgi:ComF family protein
MLPNVCAVCRAWGRSRVCMQCVACFEGKCARCTRCALEVPHGVTICGSCLVRPPAFERTWAAVHYSYPWDGLIARFKFQGHLDLASALVHLMLSAAPADVLAAAQGALMVPVPLSAARLNARGYNQAWELARRLARHCMCPAQPQWLLRVKDTPHQLDLARHQRAANVRNVFLVEPRKRAELSGQTVILVDDVMTTGATADEAARVLLQAGAANVWVWVLARTSQAGLA